jgi:integrase
VKIMLTDRGLKAMKPAAPGTRKMIWDAAVPGFGVRVTDKGKLTFSVVRRLNGKLVRWTLGQYPVMSLAEARDAAMDALRDIAKGVDPNQKKEAQRRAEALKRANSFASVAEEFIARHTSKLARPAEAEALVRRELIARWGEKPISDISRRDIIAVIEEIADSGRPYAAHKAYAFVSKFFTWAIARNLYGLEASPCTAIRPKEILGAKEARQRVLSDSEIRTLWQTTEAFGYPVAPFIRLLLLTGQRLREVAEMVWSEVDLEKALWVIPPERMKGDAAHEVPLPQAAVEILKSIPRWTGGDFVLSTTGGLRPISGFSKMKTRIDRALDGQVAAWRYHDLRRTLRTGLGALSVPSNIAELIIAHRQPSLHRVYDRYGYRDEKRRAFELWAARVGEIIAEGGPDNVVRLRTA